MEFLELIFVGVVIFVTAGLAFLIGKFLTQKFWEDQIQQIREDAIKKSRSVLGGQFAEQLAPFLPNFPFSPSEARFIGKPIDFIVFKGADEKNITEVVFVEVKSGKAKINVHERNLKEAIENKKVSWMEYRIPEEITK